MALGPGKYDQLCTLVREAAQAKGAILIIFEGVYGQGFSCQSDPDTLASLPTILRIIARDIEADLKRNPLPQPSN